MNASAMFGRFCSKIWPRPWATRETLMLSTCSPSSAVRLCFFGNICRRFFRFKFLGGSHEAVPIVSFSLFGSTKGFSQHEMDQLTDLRTSRPALAYSRPVQQSCVQGSQGQTGLRTAVLAGYADDLDDVALRSRHWWCWLRAARSACLPLALLKGADWKSLSIFLSIPRREHSNRCNRGSEIRSMGDGQYKNSAYTASGRRATRRAINFLITTSFTLDVRHLRPPLYSFTTL